MVISWARESRVSLLKSWPHEKDVGFYVNSVYFMQARISDLPTPKTVKSGDFEKKKKPEKSRETGTTQTGRFPKYALNEIKMAYFLFQGILYHNIWAFFPSK